MTDYAAAVLNGEQHSAAEADALASDLRAAEAEAEATHRARVEAAIEGKGEADCEAIAKSTGLPLVDLRAAMAEARRGSSQS